MRRRTSRSNFEARAGAAVVTRHRERLLSNRSNQSRTAVCSSISASCCGVKVRGQSSQTEPCFSHTLLPHLIHLNFLSATKPILSPNHDRLGRGTWFGSFSCQDCGRAPKWLARCAPVVHCAFLHHWNQQLAVNNASTKHDSGSTRLKVKIEQFPAAQDAQNAVVRVTEKQALCVRCPVCGAKPGEKCELGTGEPRTEPHRDRRLVAWESSGPRSVAFRKWTPRDE